MIDLDDAIAAWVRTVRAGTVIHRCGSVEGQYRPTLGEIVLLEEAPQAIEPTDRRMGWAVEEAWRTLPSIRRRRLLSVHYVRNQPLLVAARRARIDRNRAEAELQGARRQLSLLLWKC